MTANPPRLRPHPLFIGRDAELAQLRAALQLVNVAVIYGVPGVGKSSLAAAYAATWPGPVVSVALHAETTLEALAIEVHRQLGVTCYCDELASLWAVLDRTRALVIVDDLHVWPAALRGRLAGSATRGRLVLTSRELIPLGPRDPDRLQLRLDGLDPAAARALWDALAELYGAGRDFTAAWQTSRGNPFVLRQAHVGILAGPVLDAGSLDDRARAVAGAVAMSGSPLPGEVLDQLAPRDVVDGLITRLVLELDRRGNYMMHALWRDALLATIDRPAAARALADALIAARDLPVVLRVREAARQLRALGCDDERAALLRTYGRALVRDGADGLLLQELEALPARTADLEYLRARTLCYGLQMRRASDGLAEATDPAIQLCFANLATWSGELGRARATLAALVDDPRIPAALRARAEVGQTWVDATRGAPVRDPGPAMRLYCAVIGDDRARAVDLAVETIARIESQPQRLWSRLITPVLCGLALSRVGRFREADAVLAWLEDAVDLPAQRVEVEWTRTVIAAERGARIAGLEALGRQLQVIERGGFFSGTVWTRLVLGRLLLALGRRRAGRAMLDAARACAHQAGSVAFDAAIAAAAREDPLADAWLTTPVEPTATPAERVRDAVRAAIRGTASGVEVPASDDFGFDRALLAVADALAARRRGQARCALQHLRRAIAEAARSGADDELIATLYDRWAEPATGLLEIDAVRHELRFGAIRCSLASRVTLRALLYAFAGAADHTLSRDEISRALWQTPYDPMRHDSSVKSSVRRLRALVGVAIEAIPDGYRLVVPCRFIA